MNLHWNYAAHNRWTADSPRGEYKLVIERGFNAPPRGDFYLIEALWLSGAIVPIARCTSLDAAQARAQAWMAQYEASLRPGAASAQPKATL